LARKIGCTLVLKNSKSSEADLFAERPEGGAGCWLSKPNNKAQQTPKLVISVGPDSVEN
jgi:hypothetical protein